MTKRLKIFLGFFGVLAMLTVVGIFVSKVSSASTDRLDDSRTDYREANVQRYQFTGKEDHTMTLHEAEAIIQNFRRTAPAGSVLGGFFGKDAVQDLLSQPGVVGIRAYFAREFDGSPTLVLFGVNERGDDVASGSGPLERWFPCPPFCPQVDTVTVVMR